MDYKPGRNQPCPCGSGTKYKKCHGASLPATTTLASEWHGPDRPMTPPLPRRTEQVSVQLAGFPGQQQHWVIVNKFKREAQKPSSPVGHQGEYRVVYVLSRPGHSPTTDRDVSFDLGAQGDSHLIMDPPNARDRGPGETIQMNVETEYARRELNFECHPNAAGFIARIETTIRAGAFADADLIASRALSPFLSLWSVTQNVPVHVHQTEITETRTGNRRVTLTMPFYEAPPPPLVHGVSDEFLWFAALFREALNTNSP
jgi:hypothetical protein